MKLLTFTYLLSLIFLLQVPAYAQDDASASEALSSDGDKLLFQDIPSVYTASKYEQKVTKAPASVSIVTADEIKKWGYRNFGDIIASLKGFYSSNDRNYGYIGSRGFSLPSDYNTRLLLLVDGHRYNDNIFESFYADEGFPVDVDMIERVEVVRGPSSSLYGTSAFFGVINVITKRGRDLKGANIKTSYGSFNATKTSASYGKRFGNGIEAFLGGSFYDSDGNDHFFSKEFDDPATNNGFYDSNDDEQAKKLLAKLTYGDFTLEGLVVDRKKKLPTAPFGTVFNVPGTNTIDQAQFYELKYDHTFENQLNVQSKVSYNYYRYTGNYIIFDETTGQNVDNKDLARGQWWRGNLEATQIFWDDHKVTFGGEFQYDFDKYQNNFDQLADGSTANSRPTDASGYRWALYAQDEFNITDKLTLNAGLRYDFFSTFGGTLNPRLALIYNPWEKTSVKLLYGTAFRSPSEFEANSPLLGVIANANLSPEELETTELVLEHYFNESLRGEFNIYHTEVNNIINQVQIDTDVAQNQNVDNVNSNGIELQLEDSWSNGFQARISYSWQDTQYKANSERLPNSPEHMVKLNLIAPLWQDIVFLGFETRYMSGRKVQPKDDGNPAGEVGDNFISNLTVFTRNWVKGLELSAGAYNLFDERYFDPASNDFRQTGIQQDGLTFRVKASLDF
ncbi:TonB-dependent receptor plug domain-containing protein [Methyloglobulus sp.]|uniref:TonB-dependent receptor plug domain-containing protein n=1 Tax=Methyloglobulus sp. TaxID=2518622 RepID=UPI003988AB43